MILSDNGPEFKNNKLQEELKKLNIKQLFSETYRPLGQIERLNGSLKRWIFRHFTMFNTKIWIDILPK